MAHIKKNILINSQMIFHLYERHSLKATVLESGKKSINWVSVGNFETLRQPDAPPDEGTVGPASRWKLTMNFSFVFGLHQPD